MTLSPPASPFLPSVPDFTYNGGAAAGVIGSYDLVCFPGMMVSILAEDTATCSTGAAMAATRLSVEDPRHGFCGAPTSAGTTDSSVLGLVGLRTEESGGYANQFQFPPRQKAMADLAGVMLVMGEYVALILQKALQGPASNSQNSAEDDKKYG